MAELRAVKPGEKPKRTPKMTVTKAASDGTTRDLLVALRDRLAKDVESSATPARDLAALTRRLLEITEGIEAIDARAAEDAEGAGANTPDDDWEAV